MFVIFKHVRAGYSGGMTVETVVIAGGPGSGKTAVVHFLKRCHYRVFDEADRLVLTRTSQFKRSDAVKARGVVFQRHIWQLQARQFRKAKRLHAGAIRAERRVGEDADGRQARKPAISRRVGRKSAPRWGWQDAPLQARVVFFDRGIPDSFAYLSLTHDSPPPELIEVAKKVRYDHVFFLDPLPFYEQDALRAESKAEAQRIQKMIHQAYRRCGYEPIRVLFDTVEGRVWFILEQLRSTGSKTMRGGYKTTDC
jgi:predicted ATPase